MRGDVRLEGRAAPLGADLPLWPVGDPHIAAEPGCHQNRLPGPLGDQAAVAVIAQVVEHQHQIQVRAECLRALGHRAEQQHLARVQGFSQRVGGSAGIFESRQAMIAGRGHQPRLQRHRRPARSHSRREHRPRRPQSPRRCRLRRLTGAVCAVRRAGCVGWVWCCVVWGPWVILVSWLGWLGVRVCPG